MKNSDAKELVKKVFELIHDAKNMNDLENIFISCEGLKKSKKDANKYPKLEFSIKSTDIKKLINEKIIVGDYKISLKSIKDDENTLTKLLYAIVWKQGDLLKINHIIKGILNVNEDELEHGITFNQFGKYLASGDTEPIIDQHVIRAYACFNSIEDSTEFCKNRKLDILKASHLETINKYKNWLISHEINYKIEFKNREFLFHIDNILFALGKAIKVNKKQNCS